MKSTWNRIARTPFIVAVACACGNEPPAEPEDFDEILGVGEKSDSYEDYARWKARLYKEPGANGAYLVDLDHAVVGEKRLKRYYQKHLASVTRGTSGVAERRDPLIVQKGISGDAIWGAAQKKKLSYCVSDGFGDRKSRVVEAMRDAASAWRHAADIGFAYVPAADTACDEKNEAVVFDVRPASGAWYLARAFFPDSPRAERSLIIDSSSFETEAPLALTGILRHELGHTLGFRHEHTRPEASAASCFEDSSWREVTPYDRASVMHYPQCNGTGDWSLVLTDSDRSGAASVYGSPTDDPLSTPASGILTETTFAGDVVAAAELRFGPIDVAPGTALHAQMTGTGDADLYLRWDAQPTTTAFDCAPFLDSTDEDCLVTVPATARTVHFLARVSARALPSQLRVVVTYFAPPPGAPDPAPAPSPTPAPAPTPAPSAWAGTRQLGTATEDFAAGVAVDRRDGAIYVAGSTRGAMTGDANAGGPDIFLAKLTSAGTTEWMRQLGTAADDYANGIAVDGDGNILVAGSTNGGLDGHTSAGGFDIVLAKWNAAGERLWTGQLGSAADDIGAAVAVDTAGNIFVAGITSGVLEGNASAGERDIFLAKWSGAGERRWTRQIGSAASDYGTSVAVDSDGNAFVGGWTLGALDGNTNAGSGDAVLIKWSGAGTKLWARQFGTTSLDTISAVAVDSNGNAYVTGSTLGELDGAWAMGGGDVFLAKYDGTGAKQWTRQFGTTSWDEAAGIAVETSGDVYVTGNTSGTLDRNAGKTDAFLLKYTAAGVKKWTRQFGTGDYDFARGVAVDANGGVFVAGSTRGDLVARDTTRPPGSDVYLVKFDADGVKR